MGVALAIALLAFLTSHLSIVVGLAGLPSAWRAPAALVVPPLAAWWGWKGGMRLRVLVWGGALALYALGVLAT